MERRETLFHVRTTNAFNPAYTRMTPLSPKHRVEVIDRTYAAILAAKTPAERVAMIADCHRSARLILAAGERMKHPELTEERIAESVSRRMLHGAI